MTRLVLTTVKLITLTLFSWTLLFAYPAFAQSAVAANQIEKLASQFSVSPDVLKKFSGMSLPDLNNGLGLAKQLSGKGGLSMDQATDKIMGAAMNGKGWDDIATEFGLDAVAGQSGATKAASKVKGGVVGGNKPVKEGKPKIKGIK